MFQILLIAIFWEYLYNGYISIPATMQPAGNGVLILEVITHNDASYSIGLLWMSEYTQHSQETCPGGIRTHNPSSERP